MAEQFYQWDSKSLIETQFSLATSKPNSHWQQSKPNFYWQHQIPIFINTTLSKKKRAQDYQSLAKEKKKKYIYIYISCCQSKKGSLQVFMKKPKKKKVCLLIKVHEE